MSGAEINKTVYLRRTDWKIKRIMRPRHLLPAGFGITIALITNLCGQPANDLWQVYQTVLRKAKYIGLTHTITPTIPVWKGFGPSKFAPTVNPENGTAGRYFDRR